MDRGAWWPTVHGVTKSRTWLSNWIRTHTNVSFSYSAIIVCLCVCLYVCVCVSVVVSWSPHPVHEGKVLHVVGHSQMELRYQVGTSCLLVSREDHLEAPFYDPWKSKLTLTFLVQALEFYFSQLLQTQNSCLHWASLVKRSSYFPTYTVSTLYHFTQCEIQP